MSAQKKTADPKSGLQKWYSPPNFTRRRLLFDALSNAARTAVHGRPNGAYL
jgi:hypothetical protein